MTVAGPSQGDFLALHVRSNHEWKAEAFLKGAGIEGFVPYYLAKRQWTDRVVETKRPLFKGYLFARAGARGEVVKTPGLVQVVGFAGRLATVPHETVESLRILCASGGTRPCAYLREGVRARIKTGALKGAVGVIVPGRGKKAHLVVSVHLLGRSVFVPIDRYEVESVAG